MLTQTSISFMKLRKKLLCLLIVLIGFAFNLPINAEDWPMWRFDAGRTANSPEELNNELYLQWMRRLDAPKSCWPSSEYRMQFDASYEPVIMGDTLFVSSMVRDCVLAFDTETGREKWTFYAEGPVRFAPVAWQGKIYFISDDSYLYCLNAKDGALLWKFQGSPTDYRLLGNERLISMWPARGGPVITDGIIYFAASIWPFMGTFIHAVDAESGHSIWTNSRSGSDFILQPHSSPAFAGVAPQGYLAVSGDKLLISGGRSVPACYDRHSGEFQYYHAVTKHGGYKFIAGEKLLFNDGDIYNLEDGKSLASNPASVITQDMMLGVDSGGSLIARDLEYTTTHYTDRKGKKQSRNTFPKLWTIENAFDSIFLKAGSRLYGGSKDLVCSFAIPDKGTEAESSTVWQSAIEGEPWSMAAANGKLYVVTKEGLLYCFGSKKIHPYTLKRTISSLLPKDDSVTRMAQDIIDETGITDGYCLVLGMGTGRLAEEIIQQSNLNVIGFDPDPSKVDSLRRKFDSQGLYGSRISLITGDIASAPLAPYLANLVVSENINDSGLSGNQDFVKHLFHVLRPYGGTAYFSLTNPLRSIFITQAENSELPNADFQFKDNSIILKREGSLPGAAEWTHQYGNIANTVCSKDSVVKPPLGPLWFGGPPHLDVLPRHGHGPPQQIVGGRLFIEGINVLSARDVYTGRVLWRKEFPKLNTLDMYYTDTYDPDPFYRGGNQRHYPGANAFGTNFIATKDRIYLVCENSCIVLDPVNGDEIDCFTLPPNETGDIRNWGYIGVYKDLLIAGASPLHVFLHNDKSIVIPNNRFGIGSKYIIVLDRYSGKKKWEHRAVSNYRHNAIVAGNGTLFCIDAITDKRADLLKRRGKYITENSTIQAFDIQSGEEKWNVSENVFGTWLGYSEEYDALLQAGSRSGDRAFDEIDRGMSVLNGSNGNVIWKNSDKYSGPCIIHHDTIITQTGGSNQTASPAKIYNLLTGKIVTTTHPLTGDSIPQSWVRFKGCNTAIASEHLLTFRSAAAAYVDLTNQGETTTIGGFRSGCTSNLVAADGVLNAPDFTRTCTCSYQNQTSLALINMPEGFYDFPPVESWSFDYYPDPKEPSPVKHIGINFGAAGNRLNDDGLLWIEYPSVGGPSPDIPILIKNVTPTIFRRHSSLLSEEAGTSTAWVASSGITGELEISIRPFLQPSAADEKKEINAFKNNAQTNKFDNRFNDITGSHASFQSYRIVLHFFEEEGLQVGDRIFDVFIQGEKRLENFDIVKETGNSIGCIVKVIENVKVKDDLRISLKCSGSNTEYLPILSGLEIHLE
jgi:outer membrane protein assembly factor BamB